VKHECHLTYDVKDAATVESIGVAADLNFKFSRIDGDPLMGAKPFCYLTAYHENPTILFGLMNAVALALEKVGISPLREKIERIVYDTKTGINEIYRATVGTADEQG
jgi:hypothetical protein